MKYRLIVFVLLSTVFILTACAGQAPAQFPTAGPTVKGQPTQVPPTVIPPQENNIKSNITKSDIQGAVTVEITPDNLDNPGDTLIFDVSMNTHSVDLSMDLAQLAVLSTDTGKTVQATQWDAPRGGHHLEGKLSFPSTLDGKNLLDGAKSVTLTLNNVDAAARIFTWQLTS